MKKIPRKRVTSEEILKYGDKIILYDGKTRKIQDKEALLTETMYCGVELSTALESRVEVQNVYYLIKRVYDSSGILIAERLNYHSELLATNKGQLRATRVSQKDKMQVSKELKAKYQADDQKKRRKYRAHAQKISSVTFDELTSEAKKEVSVRLKKYGAKSVDFKELSNGKGVTVSCVPCQSLLCLFN